MADIEKIRRKRLEKIKKPEKRSLSNSLRRKVYKKDKPFDFDVINTTPSDIFIVNPDSFSIQYSLLFEESLEDQEMVEIMFKQFSRVNKFLFSKYSTVTNYKKITPVFTFDKILDSKGILSEAGFSKMVRDNKISHNMIGIEEIKSIYKFLIAKLKVSFISFENFPELIYLLSVFIFSKSPYDLSKCPPVKQVEALYEALKTLSDSVPKYLFDEADPGIWNKDVINALNELLDKNPEAELPNGYKKMNELVIMTEYKAFTGSKIQNLCVEILDNIFFEAFETHFLMPIVHKSSKIRAKGILTEEVLSLSVNYNSKTESLPGFSKLTQTMKIHSLSLNNVTQSIALECSQLLDDIIYSIEKNSFVLISRVPKPSKMLTNRFIEDKNLKNKKFLKKNQQKN